MEELICAIDQDVLVNWDDEDPFDIAGIIKVRLRVFGLNSEGVFV